MCAWIYAAALLLSLARAFVDASAEILSRSRAQWKIEQCYATPDRESGNSTDQSWRLDFRVRCARPPRDWFSPLDTNLSHFGGFHYPHTPAHLLLIAFFTVGHHVVGDESTVLCSRAHEMWLFCRTLTRFKFTSAVIKVEWPFLVHGKICPPSIWFPWTSIQYWIVIFQQLFFLLQFSIRRMQNARNFLSTLVYFEIDRIKFPKLLFRLILFNGILKTKAFYDCWSHMFI